MNNIIDAPFMLEMRKICNLMYKKGWDERNGGNVSYLLKENELEEYLDYLNNNREFNELESPIPSLASKCFLITGTGKYLKNVFEKPEDNLGIIKISEDGSKYKIIWGLPNSKPTSEISTHLLCHKTRLEVDSEHRVIIHNHATNIEAMTFVEELSDKNFTKILWKMQTESIVVFPEGIGILPWMVWAHHGILGAGKNFDETFGLIETAEKAAEIYIKIANLKIKQTIKDNELKTLAETFKVDYNKKFLK